jgi:hypothetical protein
MPNKYRAYQKDKEGRAIGLPDIIPCDDDETAIKRAELLGIGDQVGLWHGDRLVARLPRRAANTSRARHACSIRGAIVSSQNAHLD